MAYRSDFESVIILLAEGFDLDGDMHQVPLEFKSINLQRSIQNISSV